MSKTYVYLRVSTLEQDNEKFKDDILRYANKKNLGTVKFVDEKISGTKKTMKENLVSY